MEELLKIYKKELYERLSLKKTNNKTYEQIILDNFKYFDLNSNNYCNVVDFIRANERIGVEMRKKDDFNRVFDYFDKNNSGVINYRIFAKQILNIEIKEPINYTMNNNFFNNNDTNDSKRKRNRYNKNLESNEHDMYKTNSINNYNNIKNIHNDESEKNYEYNEKKVNIKENTCFNKIIIFLLNNENIPSKSLLLFYKNFKIILKSKSYNKISLNQLINIISKNNIDLYIKDIHELFNYYKNENDEYFYYEKFFEDIINIYWNEERNSFSEKKISEILYKYKNKDKVLESNKIRIEDFYNLISITKNNNYNIISVNNYFKNKLKISNPDNYYNELVRTFLEIKYLTTTNKDSSITNKDILQLIKFISFGIKSDEDFYTAINYIFNTNKFAILNKKIETKKNYDLNIIKDKYNYNTSLSSLISIRKYMIGNGIQKFIKLIKNMNLLSNGRFIKKYEFAKIIKDFNILISVNDIEQIFDNFCLDKKKLYLNYFKFIDILLDEFITKEKIELINNIYKKIEKKLNIVNLENLEEIYNPKNNYYQYNEFEAKEYFFENLKNFHFEFYLKKISDSNNIDNSAYNFRISYDEFLNFYKMISFIIEKDEMFQDIICNEWSKVLIEGVEDNNCNKDEYSQENNYKSDEYDDYDDYNIKHDEIINYKKLKNDLLIKPIHTQENNEFNDIKINRGQIKKIPINKMPRQNSNSNIHHLNLEPKRIFRPSNSRGNFNNSINHPNSCIDNNNISPLEKLTKKLKLRGLRGIMNLHKQFIFTCPNLSHINLSYFIQVLKNQKINLEKNEYFDIFEKFSKNNILNFTKFIREFKKPLNDTRLQSVEDAFSKLDVDSNDNIFIETIKKKYNPKGSPLVKQGIKNEEEVTTEFLDCFELNYNLLTAVDNQNVTNVVSFEEFANFYEYVSFLYDNDDEFCKMVEESWDD